MAHLRIVRLGFCCAALLAAGALPAHAVSIGFPPNPHFTNGLFDPDEWSTARGSVSKQVFTQGTDGSGGAALYVEQGTPFGTNKLYLMYDYFNPAASRFLDPIAHVAFSVFFQVPRDNEDYLVEITNGGITGVFTKDVADPSQTNPDGTLNSGPPWTPASAGDIATGKFVGKVGFGISPDSATEHPLAEFELTFDQLAFGGTQTGLYDPAPAFWAAGAVGNFLSQGMAAAGSFDPPISSAIFQLNPDGSTFVLPVLDPTTRGPVSQGNVPPTTKVPEPASVLLLGAGLAVLAARRRRAS